MSVLSPQAFRAAVLAAGIALVAPGAGRGAEFSAGGYLFSDELGGFRLLSARGGGTPDDPVVLVEEIYDIAPATLVIRDLNLVAGRPLQAQLTLVKRVTNRSVRVWAAFEMELQEIKGKPSIYSDGLSFKQFDSTNKDVSSDSFTKNERDFEPYDRIQFLDGHVDPDEVGEFKITITDPTPTPEFYLVQEPKLLSAGLPKAGPHFAANRPADSDHAGERSCSDGKY